MLTPYQLVGAAAKMLNILLKFVFILFILDFTIAITAISKYSYFDNVCREFVDVLLQQQGTIEDALRFHDS